MATEINTLTYDPSDFKVTLHPYLGRQSIFIGDIEGITSFWDTQVYLPSEITEFAPGTAMSASLNKNSVISHAGVNGETLTTSSVNARGTVTLNLLSIGTQAKAIINIFNSLSVSNSFSEYNLSPISSIRVSRTYTDEKGDKITSHVLTASNCWLLKVPDWSLTQDAFYTSLVFDCNRILLKHG